MAGVLAGVFGGLLALAPMTVYAVQGPAAPRDEAPVERPRAGRDSAKGSAKTATDAKATTTEKEDEAAAAARREALLRINARGTRVRVGGDVVVAENERLGDVVAIFGKADVRGVVSGDLVAVGGDVHLGPNALVRGDVVVVGGAVRAANGAWIGGKVSEVRFSTSDLRVWLPDEGEVTVAFQPDWPRIARITFVSGMMRNLFWFVICAVLLVITPGAVKRVRDQASASPIAAFAVGFVAELLFVPVMLLIAVLLSISIVGVPLLALLPVIALLFAFAMAIGFTAVASSFGQSLVGRATPLFALVLGLSLVWATGMAGRYLWVTSNGRFGWWLALLAVGFLVEFFVCTLGLGAALMAWSARKQGRAQAAARVMPPVPDTPNPIPQSL